MNDAGCAGLFVAWSLLGETEQKERLPKTHNITEPCKKKGHAIFLSVSARPHLLVGAVLGLCTNNMAVQCKGKGKRKLKPRKDSTTASSCMIHMQHYPASR